ncbi:MAG: hypothetical protein R3F18_18430 [Lysobacterales bacterium]
MLAVPGRRYGEFAELVRAVSFAEGVGETRWQERRLVLAHDADRAQEQRLARESPSQRWRPKAIAWQPAWMRKTKASRSAGVDPTTDGRISSSPK